MSARRVLLVVPTQSYRVADFLRAADALGLEVVVASEHAQVLAPALGDRTLAVDLGDLERGGDQIEAYSARFPLAAILAVDQAGVALACAASARLGLRHNSLDAVLAAADKIEQRQRFLRARVAQPDFRILAPGEAPCRAAAALGYPCVLKPPCLSGSQGVIRVDDEQGAVAAAQRIRGILEQAGQDTESPLLVERFVPGGEVAVEGLLSSGTLNALAIFDKPEPMAGPYFEETLLVTPSRLPASLQKRILALAADAVAAIGLTEGPVHIEIRSDGHALWLIELAARSIGGYCSRALHFSGGHKLETLILEQALNGRVSKPRPTRASGVMMLPIPRQGVLRAVHGRDRASATPGITALNITVPIGDFVAPPPEGSRYLGFMFAEGSTPHEVETALRDAFGRLRIEVETSAISSPGDSRDSRRPRAGSYRQPPISRGTRT